MKSVRSDRRRDGRGPGFVYCVLVMALMLDELAARMQVSRCCAHLVTNREGALRLIGIIQQFRMMHLQVQPLVALEASHDFRFGEEWHGHAYMVGSGQISLPDLDSSRQSFPGVMWQNVDICIEM